MQGLTSVALVSEIIAWQTSVMRLFVALMLPHEAELALEDVQARLPAGRLTPPENFHLTLAFIGDAGPDEAQALHEGLETLDASEVLLTLGGAEVFGGRYGQAVAIGANGGSALRQLHDRVRARLHGAGLPAERRRFRPHVTLARLSGRADAGPLLLAMSGLALGPFTCTGFALVSSELHPDGARHEVLADYPLRPLCENTPLFRENDNITKL